MEGFALAYSRKIGHVETCKSEKEEGGDKVEVIDMMR